MYCTRRSNGTGTGTLRVCELKKKKKREGSNLLMFAVVGIRQATI